MSGHTRGPWRIDDEAASNVLEIWADDGSRHGVNVAQVWDPDGPGGQTEQMWADARLITASPDGIEAAKQAVGCFDTHGVVDAESIAALRAFIAKAEGAD